MNSGVGVLVLWRGHLSHIVKMHYILLYHYTVQLLGRIIFLQLGTIHEVSLKYLPHRLNSKNNTLKKSDLILRNNIELPFWGTASIDSLIRPLQNSK